MAESGGVLFSSTIADLAWIIMTAGLSTDVEPWIFRIHSRIVISCTAGLG